MYCCWFEMRPRSLPSPTPYRVRRNCSAVTPDTVWVPAAKSSPVLPSRMPRARHTSTPPIASVTWMTPPKVTTAPNGMLRLLSAETC